MFTNKPRVTECPQPMSRRRYPNETGNVPRVNAQVDRIKSSSAVVSDNFEVISFLFFLFFYRTTLIHRKHSSYTLKRGSLLLVISWRPPAWLRPLQASCSAPAFPLLPPTRPRASTSPPSLNQVEGRWWFAPKRRRRRHQLQRQKPNLR
ncbi:hypothetical protein Cni_G14520 [Canna indica]|uniref:Uncharacterized protein n=1 Tax=Canna indica TaxID=4628 RepID=A0AAQ3QCG3_9LILI|nr:hypothetical protein Cni_G14520 [Canna indica]